MKLNFLTLCRIKWNTFTMSKPFTRDDGQSELCLDPVKREGGFSDHSTGIRGIIDTKGSCNLSYNGADINSIAAATINYNKQIFYLKTQKTIDIF